MTMALDLARALDPVVFAKDCGLTPDPWQAELLRSTARRALLLCSRQSGKSTVTALLALWVALFEAGLVVIVSPSQRQSAEMLRTIKGFLAHLKNGPSIAAESALKIEFTNGARILALPGTEKTIRGIAGAALIVIDEAARVEDELLAAVRPMLATAKDGGRLIALTTPAGKRGFFFESWTGTGDWTRVKVAASDCPRISKEFLAEELKELGAMRFSEEYELEFRDNDEAVFPMAIIAAAFTQEVQPLWN
ncbi:terminase family protein [Bradyrhizobium sp. JYMT SZCCT0428]|nr:terminase family protein [Bradyrhizobium sp. JYMT SZCCT0428]